MFNDLFIYEVKVKRDIAKTKAMSSDFLQSNIYIIRAPLNLTTRSRFL